MQAVRMRAVCGAAVALAAWTTAVCAGETRTSTVIESQMFKGKVVAVTLADAVKGVKPEITVVNDQGQEMSFVVTQGIDFMTTDGKIMSLKKLREGDRVTVEYTTTKVAGTRRALAISVQASASPQ